MSGALTLAGLRKSFGAAEIIRGVDLEIEDGERHAIIGPNGAGKSTLYNLISGRFPPSAGRVHLYDTDITDKKAFDINRLGLTRSFQVTNIFARMSVLDNVRCGCLYALGHRYAWWKLVGRLQDVNEQTASILRDIGLWEKRELPAGLLSYADQRALELGIAIAGG
ncbi:MAG: ATP-binding cassette domain-containing protein, partial [Rhodospirillaceae bacterium]|nr:ATP-binding cassette domain-containing protein [Rhodospirillaceae bacterium]